MRHQGLRRYGLPRAKVHSDPGKLQSELGLTNGKKTTDDLNFTVETVSCLGACGLAPVLTVNDVVHPEMTPDKVVALLKTLREEIDHAE